MCNAILSRKNEIHRIKKTTFYIEGHPVYIRIFSVIIWCLIQNLYLKSGNGYVLKIRFTGLLTRTTRLPWDCRCLDKSSNFYVFFFNNSKKKLVFFSTCCIFSLFDHTSVCCSSLLDLRILISCRQGKNAFWRIFLTICSCLCMVWLSIPSFNDTTFSAPMFS